MRRGQLRYGPPDRQGALSAVLGRPGADPVPLRADAMARITLEDLERLGEEPAAADGDGSDGEDDQEGQARLFAHWEAVASTHRVSLPRGERRG